MKLIIAVIKPHRLEDVVQELDAVGIKLKTVSHILGSGLEEGHKEIYRGRMETGNLLKKVRLDIAVNDEVLEKTIAAIIKGAQTGNIGDGKIFVVNLVDCINIRTSERGPAAIGQ